MSISTFGGAPASDSGSGSGSVGGGSIGDGMVVGQVVQAGGGVNLLPADGRILNKIEYPLAYQALNNDANDVATLQVNTTALPIPGVYGAYQGVAYVKSTDTFGMLSGANFSISKDSGKTWTLSALPTNVGSFISLAASEDKFCLLTTSYALTSVDGINWITGAALPFTPSPVASFAFTGQRFVYVLSGLTMYSLNGTDWVCPSIPLSMVNKIILQPGGNYIAFGSITISNTATDKIATSPDGENWTVRTLPAAETFYAFAATSSVVCMLTSTKSYTSLDGGVTWTATAFAGAFTLLTPGMTANNLCATDNTFILSNLAPTGGPTNATYKSADGINWTLIGGFAQMNSAFSQNLATDGVNTIVAPSSLGGSTVLVSKDRGVTWQVAILPVPNNYNFIFWSGTQFILVGHTSTTSLKSADGLTWTVASNAVPAMPQGIGMYHYNAALNTHFLVALGANGTVVLTSQDGGITWTARALPASMACYGIASIGAKTLISNSASTVAVTTNGTSFTSQAAAGAGNMLMAANSSLYVRVASQVANVTTAITTSTSPDGVTWTARTLPAVPAGFWPTNVTAVGEMFYVFSPSTNSMMTSPDGINWTLVTNVWPQSYSVQATNNAHCINVLKFGAGVMFPIRMVGASDTIVLYSTNMAAWTQVLNRIPRANQGIVKFVGVNGSGGGGNKLIACTAPFIYSYDDTNGLSISLLAPNLTGVFAPSYTGSGSNGAIYSPALSSTGECYLFCVSGGVTDNSGLKTSDFLTWTPFTQPELTQGDAICVNGKFSMLGATSLYSTQDGTAFVKTFMSHFGNGTNGSATRNLCGSSTKAFVTYTFGVNASYTSGNLGGFGYTVYSSFDGVDYKMPFPFVANVMPTTPALMIARKGNLCVLGIRSSNMNSVSVSNDGGINWRQIDLPFGNIGVSSIAYNPASDTFILLSGGNTNTCYTSKDGMSWIPRSMPSTLTWYSIAVFKGMFIATSFQSSTWAYSRDGTIWTTFTAPLPTTSNQYFYWVANDSLFLTPISSGTFSYAGAIAQYYDKETQFQLPAYNQVPGAPGWFVKVK